MLSREENELITHTGPGTPMGDVMRRYWMPILLERELAEPDGEPVKVQVLGERLVAFRDTNGKHRPDRRVLSAPPRLAVARPQRRVRAALRVPRLEIRRRRQLRRSDERARRKQLRRKGAHHALPDAGAGRDRLDLYGSARETAASAVLRVHPGAGHATATSRKSSRSATGCRRSKAASTRRTRRSCTVRCAPAATAPGHRSAQPVRARRSADSSKST